MHCICQRPALCVHTGDSVNCLNCLWCFLNCSFLWFTFLSLLFVRQEMKIYLHTPLVKPVCVASLCCVVVWCVGQRGWEAASEGCWFKSWLQLLKEVRSHCELLTLCTEDMYTTTAGSRTQRHTKQPLRFKQPQTLRTAKKHSHRPAKQRHTKPPQSDTRGPQRDSNTTDSQLFLILMSVHINTFF